MKKIELLVLVGACLGWAGSAWAQSLSFSCDPGSCGGGTELEQARSYLIDTARPGGTMARQGPSLAIQRLHPEFAIRLAKAIQAARRAGLDEAGLFSAYRPPVFGVGGFADKYYSLHAYGLAVDMHGIGRPGSADAQRWHEIAAGHGIVCPYGYRSRVEWNHCQPTRLQAVKAENPLRETITASGPIDLERMFEVGRSFLAAAETTISTVVGAGAQGEPAPLIGAGSIGALSRKPVTRGLSRKPQMAASNHRLARTAKRLAQRKARLQAQTRVASWVKRSK